MRALTLIEPWATFMALGLKTIETRSWYASIRDRVMIHASKSRKCLDQANEILERAGHPTRFNPDYDWPLGKIVAVVEVYGCKTTVGIGALSKCEYAMGDYSEYTLSKGVRRKRFGILTRNLWRVPAPVDCKGALSFWQVPPDIEAQVLAQKRS